MALFSSEEMDALVTLCAKAGGKIILPAKTEDSTHASPAFLEAQGKLRELGIRAYFSTSLFNETHIYVFEHLSRRIL
jgi:hypothetical protein